MNLINHVGISGGKDSTALLLWAVHESGYDRDSIIATFCDTGNEAPETYAYIAMLNERVHPVETIKPPLDMWELAKYKKRFPSTKARFCTTELKMKPTKVRIQEMQAAGYEVLMHSGVRANESDDRAKLLEREPAWLSYFGADVYRPLLSWTIADVWAIHARYGVEPNPLYAMGCKRVGCLPCIMSRKAEIANIAKRWPEKIDFLRDQENSMPNAVGFSSFFAQDKVPARFRSREFKLKPLKVKDGPQPEMDLGVEPNGRSVMVPSIDDVVSWADVPEAAASLEFDFFEDVPAACDSRYGACE